MSIDEAVAGREKVTFIKMDVEGAEIELLKGAKNTILKDKPKLAICIYHKAQDMIDLPVYIKSLVPEYRLYKTSFQWRRRNCFICNAIILGGSNFYDIKKC